MASRIISPERILSTRMLLHIPANSPLRFSVLDFPYTNALKAFMNRFESIYQHKYDKKLPFNLKPPFRQLNDTLLTLAPGLIQAFEYIDGEQGKQRIVAFTRYHDNEQGETSEDFPSQEQFQSLIRHWLERWGEHPEVQPLLKGDGQAAWQTLMNALNNAPETDWEHGITPIELASDLNSMSSLSYIALPALLTSMLHMKEMTIQSEKGTYPIQWRRVNEGGKNGLYLVSQPFSFEGDYFAYCLDFSVQTQTGHIDQHDQQDFWIFAHLSIQRYITERLRKENQRRNVSILVGYNREHFISGWDDNTTLIRLPVEKIKGEWVWESGVGKLLDDFSVRKLLSPNDILTSPRSYGNYTGNTKVLENEYYPIFAEGHKFGDIRGRAHRVKTGTSLRERSQIMAGILYLFEGWLEVSAPLKMDIQNPKNTLALRNYEYMVDKTRRDNSEQEASWRTALQTSLSNSDQSHVHIVVLFRSPMFQEWANKQLDETLMEVNKGDNPLATVICKPIEPMLYTSLDSGGFDPKSQSTKRRQKLRDSYSIKVNEWRNFLQKIQWRQDARRLVLIDSTGEFDVSHDQQIKGAVREACIREGISSQFLIGNLKLDSNPKAAGKLDGGSAGRLQNAVLDLTVRQQGILYAPPREIYERAAKLDAETAAQLDVIAFCRVKRTKFADIQYVLAVRLRASAEVDVMLPGKDMDWLPYDTAAYQVGSQLADSRVAIQRKDKPHPFHLDQGGMVNFVEHVLTRRLERPTIAVIEAEGWRNSGKQGNCWIQLSNANLFKNQDVLNFGTYRVYQRTNPALDPLLGVVRLRMNNETPQYITADDWKPADEMRDIKHLTGYLDQSVTNPMHYMSIAGLSEGQKKQRDRNVLEMFKGDPKEKRFNLAYKHPQIVELVPFFVHPRFQNDEGLWQLCRCIHFLRISPGFTMSEIVLPYAMYLGEKLIEDLLCIVGIDD